MIQGIHTDERVQRQVGKMRPVGHPEPRRTGEGCETAKEKGSRSQEHEESQCLMVTYPLGHTQQRGAQRNVTGLATPLAVCHRGHVIVRSPKGAAPSLEWALQPHPSEAAAERKGGPGIFLSLGALMVFRSEPICLSKRHILGWPALGPSRVSPPT